MDQECGRNLDFGPHSEEGGDNKGHLCFLVASLGTGRGDFFHVAILPFALNKKARFML